jgi:hypothetical protein
MKGFDRKIKVAIKKLPMLEPEKDVWEVINKRLDFDQKLSSTLQELPLYMPREELWTGIEINLPGKPHTRNLRNIVIGLSAAASIVIFVGTWFLKNNGTRETITVSEEMENDWGQSELLKNDPSNQSALLFIEEQCKNMTYVCEMPGFIEKKLQLQEVNKQIIDLNSVIQSTGSTPTIVKSRIKLENIRTKLVKDLIDQINL